MVALGGAEGAVGGAMEEELFVSFPEEFSGGADAGPRRGGRGALDRHGVAGFGGGSRGKIGHEAAEEVPLSMKSEGGGGKEKVAEGVRTRERCGGRSSS